MRQLSPLERPWAEGKGREMMRGNKRCAIDPFRLLKGVFNELNVIGGGDRCFLN